MVVLGRTSGAAGLTVVQLRLLGILRDREPAMTEIARHMDLDKSSVTGLVDRAERRGLLRRIPSTDDGRSIRVALTPTGHRLADDLTQEVGRRVGEVVGALSTAESGQLAELVHRLLRAPDPAH